MIDYFHLPISFLDNKKKIGKEIINDLELQTTIDRKSLYEHIFTYDKCPFAKETIPLWSSYYTSDTHFLKDSQKIIKGKMPVIDDNHISQNVKIHELWKEIRGENNFESKYLYLDWEKLKFLNTSSVFLQCMSIYNLSSPLFSLVLPIFFLIFPFIIIKLQGVEITITKYIEVLKLLLQKHQLGQIFMYESATWDKRVYILVSIFFYFFQIYQNTLSCIKFYKNIRKIHDQLFLMRDYLHDSIKRMDYFETRCETLKTYKPFISHMKQKREILNKMYNEFNSISEYKFSLHKSSEIGLFMKYFYLLYKDKEYHNALEYSFGFNGYIYNINNLKGLLETKQISAFKNIASETGTGTGTVLQNEKRNKKIKFKNAYFPPLIGKEPIKNTYKLKKCMLITGPNAAGKTTMIKTSIFNILFCQQSGFGFFESASFSPFDYIHSYINIPDTSGRDSLFQSEARRCKDIINVMKYAGPNASHFCVFDELYSGTNPYEAIASATAFLRYLNANTNSCHMITTHFLDICNNMKKDKDVLNMHMKIDCITNGEFKYRYKIQEGISTIKGGVKVLRDLDYPKFIIDETQKLIDNTFI